MRRSSVAAIAAASALGVSATAVASTRGIEVGDNYFVRDQGGATVTIHRGDTVRWRWTGHHSHNVTVRSGPQRFHSPTKTAGTFSHHFTRAGTYTIYCTVHGPVMSMRLVVR